MTNNFDFVDFLNDKILPNINYEVALRNLNPTPKDNYFIITCPECKKREAYLYKNTGFIKCNRKNNCGYSASLISFITGIPNPRGKDFISGLKKLAQLAGIHFPERELSPEEEEKTSQKFLIQTLFEEFLRLSQEKLKQPQEISARNYLYERLDQDFINTEEFGLFPTFDEIRTHFKDRYEKNDLSIFLKDSRIQNRVIGPYRARSKQITGFWARTISLRDTNSPKYLVIGSKPDFSGIHKFDPSKPVILVEGIFDRFSLEQRGFNCLAIDGSDPSGERFKILEKLRVKEIILNMDYDGDKSCPTHSCNKMQCLTPQCNSNLKLISKLKNYNLDLFVLDPRLMVNGIEEEQQKIDPADYLKKHTAREYKHLIDSAVHSFRYQANCILNRNRPDSGWTDLSLKKVMTEAIEFDDTLKNNKVFDIKQFFWDPIMKEIGQDKAVFEKLLDSCKKEHSEKRNKELLKSLATDIIAQSDRQPFCEVMNEIKQKIHKLEPQIGNSPLKFPSMCETLPLFEAHLETLRKKDFIGLPQKSISLLDSALSGLRGLGILLGAPGVGKTTLALQFGIDILVNNPDACFIFLSLEMSRQEILIRIFCYLMRTTWQDFIAEKYSPLQYDTAKTKLITLSKRILFLDENACQNLTSDQLIFNINFFKKGTATNRVYLLVDYLQLWPIPESEFNKKNFSDLDADKWRIGDLKKIHDSLSETDFLLAISEARKPGGNSGESWGGGMADVIGSTRNAYRCDLILAISPLMDDEILNLFNQKLLKADSSTKAKEANEKRCDLEENGMVYSKLKILKGRDGMRRISIPITFLFKQSRYIPEFGFGPIE